jgi:hypothetical protein
MQGKATVYRIVVRSELTDRYASIFEGMEMETKNGQTILTGEVKDQPHLFGILDRINGLGLELLSVQARRPPEHRKGTRSKPGTGSLATSSAWLIHRSAWKVNSQKFVSRSGHLAYMLCCVLLLRSDL